MGVTAIGVPGQPATNLTAWQASIRDALNSSDVTVDSRIAAKAVSGVLLNTSYNSSVPGNTTTVLPATLVESWGTSFGAVNAGKWRLSQGGFYVVLAVATIKSSSSDYMTLATNCGGRLAANQNIWHSIYYLANYHSTFNTYATSIHMEAATGGAQSGWGPPGMGTGILLVSPAQLVILRMAP